jgi:salicylate hydroxylase
VHRAHLHEGLVKVAEKLGATLLVNSRVNKIEYNIGDKVSVTTASGSTHTFDLLVGSDGANSTVRKHLHPTVKPAPPTTNCAYRAIVPYDQVRSDPLTKDLCQKWTMEVWMSDKAYIISYPISAGQDLNVVLSHHLDRFVDTVEDINIEDLRKEYKPLIHESSAWWT